jgi:D-apionolactonase
MAADELAVPAAPPALAARAVTGTVAAGQLSAVVSGPDIFEVRWRGFEILSRLHATVRDANWFTVSPALRRVAVEDRADAAVVQLAAGHHGGDVAFAWHGSVELGPGGRLAFAMDGVAERDFEYRRIGICVLHPWGGYAGARYRASHGSRIAEGAFPHEIAPQPRRDGAFAPMINAFSMLEVALPGITLTLRFEGDLFECEDQRNWTDASFKTYPTPLARSGVRMIRAGTRITQRVVVDVSGLPSPEPEEPARPGSPVRIAVSGRHGHPVPAVGTIAPGCVPAKPAAARLRRLRPAHVRAELAVTATQPLDAALGPVDAAAALGIPIELALIVDEGAPLSASLEAVAALLSARRLARLLVHLRSGQTTPRALIEAVRLSLAPALGGTPIAGGSASHFSELNRLPPEPAGMDQVALAMSPCVHQSDERSMIETLEIQEQVVLAASRLAGGVPVAVTPVTLLPREPGAAGSPMDPRVATSFAAAWTLGSLAALGAAGACSVTFHDAVGPGGIIDANGELTPAYHVLAAAAGLRGRRLLRTQVSRRRDVAALAVRLPAGVRVFVANLTPEPLSGQLEGLQALDGAVVKLEPYQVQRLDAQVRRPLRVASLV